MFLCRVWYVGVNRPSVLHGRTERLLCPSLLLNTVHVNITWMVLKSLQDHWGLSVPGLESCLIILPGTGELRRQWVMRDDWMASLIPWTRIWTNFRGWWGAGWPGVVPSMGLRRVRHDLVTEQQQWEQKSLPYSWAHPCPGTLFSLHLTRSLANIQCQESQLHTEEFSHPVARKHSGGKCVSPHLP